jgi:hypothetical protein
MFSNGPVTWALKKWCAVFVEILDVCLLPVSLKSAMIDPSAGHVTWWLGRYGEALM